MHIKQFKLNLLGDSSKTYLIQICSIIEKSKTYIVIHQHGDSEC